MSAAALARPAFASSAAGVVPGSSGTRRLLGSTLGTWRRRALTRAALARLDLALHSDLGLDPSDVLREAAKPFWRA